MNQTVNGAMDLASVGLITVLVVAGLIAWFFINRASVKARQQVQLLEALLEEQKKQNILLHRLTDALVSNERAPASESEDFTRLIPER